MRKIWKPDPIPIHTRPFFINLNPSIISKEGNRINTTSWRRESRICFEGASINLPPLPNFWQVPDHSNTAHRKLSLSLSLSHANQKHSHKPQTLASPSVPPKVIHCYNLPSQSFKVSSSPIHLFEFHVSESIAIEFQVQSQCLMLIYNH